MNYLELIGKGIDVICTKNVMRYGIGIGCSIYGRIGMLLKKPSCTKYKWLGHYLIGDGTPLVMPKWMIEYDSVLNEEILINGEVCYRCDRNMYLCVGRFIVSYDKDHRVLHSIDKYDWNKGVFNDNVDLHEGVRIFTDSLTFCKILGLLFEYSNTLQKCLEIEYTDCVRGTNIHINVLDSFWEYLGGTPFFTILFYEYKEK